MLLSLPRKKRKHDAVKGVQGLEALGVARLPIKRLLFLVHVCMLVLLANLKVTDTNLLNVIAVSPWLLGLHAINVWHNSASKANLNDTESKPV